MNMKDKIIAWLGNGDIGQSSRAMACCVAGIKGQKWHPYDPDDLNRCLLFLEAVPEARQHMGKLKELSPTWSDLVDRWDELESTFLDEVGLDWSKATVARKTYELMLSIRNRRSA